MNLKVFGDCGRVEIIGLSLKSNHQIKYLMHTVVPIFDPSLNLEKV